MTKNAGYQIGVRRTLPVSCERAWKFLTSGYGVELWLGTQAGITFRKGAHYALKDGTAGEVLVASLNSHFRITWQPQGWQKSSTIQVRVIPHGKSTVISFHQENLPGKKERAERRLHFSGVLERLEKILTTEQKSEQLPVY